MYSREWGPSKSRTDFERREKSNMVYRGGGCPSCDMVVDHRDVHREEAEFLGELWKGIHTLGDGGM